MNKSIAIYTTMPLTNESICVHGITMFMFPLIKKLKKDGYKIYYLGNVIENKEKNIFCELMELKPYILDVTDDVEVTEDYTVLKDCDALLVYNRPQSVPLEYTGQNAYIRQALNYNKKVLFWMGDMWLLPEDIQKETILLRPFSSDKFDNLFKKAYHFEYFTHKLYDYEFEKRDKIIDYVYIGNFYNRFDILKKKFENLSGNIVVAGSWLRDEARWDKSLQLKNVLYIRETPHSMSLPLLAISKQTFYVIPEYYQDVGMKTSRIYEAKMAGCDIDVDIQHLNTLDKAYNQLIGIIYE